MMPSQSMSQQQPMDINHLQDGMINVAYNVCSIVTMPVEIVLRPRYSTRYFAPVIMLLSAGMMIVLPVLWSITESVSQMVPFMRFQQSVGMYGIASFSKLFFLLMFVHNIRIWRRMIHMEREQHSFYEGPALPIFNILPGSFWVVRIIYEPIFLVILAQVLPNFFILQPSAAHFLEFSAAMLAMKQYCAWYRQWQFLRGLMDMKNSGPIIAKIVDNTATEDELATLHLASIPKDVPEDVRRETAAHIARAFNPMDKDL